MTIPKYDEKHDWTVLPSPSTNITIEFGCHGALLRADMANIAEMTGCKWVLGPVEVMIFKEKKGRPLNWDMGNPVFERYHSADEFSERVLKADIEESRKEMDAKLAEMEAKRKQATPKTV